MRVVQSSIASEDNLNRSPAMLTASHFHDRLSLVGRSPLLKEIWDLTAGVIHVI
ncbi:hypothetical protein [Microcoleus sp. herbarium2]|uniref:hypothetical protein n=1 Tax=Microcoleus sp. herbarium2 TaxID=3055433 RepID=UPI002FD4CA02